MSFLALLFVVLIIVFVVFGKKEMQKKIIKKEKLSKLFNIVFIGAAGSGKGTQGDIIKNKLKLLKISAGDVLRDYRKDSTKKYTSVINNYIDQGKMLPSEIVNDIIQDHIESNILDKNNNYEGILFDGFPRQLGQLEFLDKFLNKNISAVIYLEVSFEDLIKRLSGRFSCNKCGEIYHKETKKCKVEGVCDICQNDSFSFRNDDADAKAIQTRFDAFEAETKSLIEIYANRGILYKVDGSQLPEIIAEDIESYLTKLKNNKR